MKAIKTLVMSCMVLCCGVSCKNASSVQNRGGVDSTAIVPVRFNADSAMAYVEAQCAFGARVPNTAAHKACGDYIVKKFEALGMQVNEQETQMKAWDGKVLEVRNIVAAYRPALKRRIVLAAHYDSRPWCDQDADSSKHREPVMAANDGASGVAVMLEVARQLKDIDDSLGVDFVCFDAEDYGAPYWGKEMEDEADWCMGSRYWAQHLPEGYRPELGILLDMVGGENTVFKLEYFSMRYAQEVVARVWAAAETVGAGKYFVKADGGAVTDDHVEVNRHGGFPMIDIIGVEGDSFPQTWHTVNDVPEHISTEVLGAVGETMMQVIYELNRE